MRQAASKVITPGLTPRNAEMRILAGLMVLVALQACQCGPQTTADDGGILDAGESDAGAYDAGILDGGAIDSGVPDAGVPDAGLQDAGFFDGGTMPSASTCERGGWCWTRPLPFGHSLLGSWGSGPSDVWAVGGNGAIAHFDGARWSLFPGTTRVILNAIWGAAPNKIWAVGENGTLLYFNGTTWAPVSLPTTNSLNAVHGTSASDVYVTGDNDTLFHFDGAQWSKVTLPVAFTTSYKTVFAFPSGEVWVAGSNSYGLAHRKPSGSWETMPIYPFRDTMFQTIWGSSESDVWISGSDAVTARWDGGTWKNILPAYMDGGFDDATTIHGSSASDVWFFGAWGNRAGHWNGQQFIPVPELMYEPLLTGWVHASGEGWAFGYGGRMAHKTAVAGPWSMVGGSPEGTYDTKNTITIVDDNDIWIGGRLGVAHWNGTTWTDVEMAVTPYRVDVIDLYAAAANDVWLVGSSSDPENALQHFDGTSWKTVPNPAQSGFQGIWASGPNDIWFKGSGELLHYNGTSFTTQVAPYGHLFQGTGPSNFWVADFSGRAFHYDGATWTPHPFGANEDPANLLVLGATDVWLSTFGGKLLRWNGNAWLPVALPASVASPRYVNALAKGPNGDVWLSVSGGDLFRYANGQWVDEGSAGISIFDLAFSPTGKQWVVGASGAALRR